MMNPLNAVRETKAALFEIEELAGKSQGLWDNAWTNAVIAQHPDRERWTQQTYQATRLHSDCMDKLRKLLADLQEMAEENTNSADYSN